MDDRDELTGIFDALTPDDFVVESTAIASMSGCYAGADVLDGFVEHQLNAVRLAFAMSDGWLFTTAVLAGRDGLRTLLARDRAMESWLSNQVAPAYDALKSDPSRAVTADQVRARLAAEHAKAR